MFQGIQKQQTIYHTEEVIEIATQSNNNQLSHPPLDVSYATECVKDMKRATLGQAAGMWVVYTAGKT